MRRLIFVFLVGLVLPLTALAQQMPAAAWIVDGSLWVNGLQVTESNACCALFSPSRTHLAYLETTDTQQNLIILDTANPQQPLLTLSADSFAPHSRLGHLAWQNDSLLWLNTFEWQPSEGLFAPLARWDLWQVDISSGSLTAFKQAGEGGAAVPSPDGTKVAVIHPGSYMTQFASIRIFDVNGEQLAFYEYPAVSGGSEQAWLPTLRWVGEGVRFAVPDADLIYSTDTLPPTLLMELSPAGVKALGEIQVDFPAAVVWSPDGNQAAYTRRKAPDALETTSLVWNISSGQETEIFAAQAFVSLVAWEDALIFYLPESGELVFWSGELQVIENVLDFVSLGGNTGLLIQGDYEQAQILYLDNGTLTPITQVAGLVTLAR